MSFWSKYFFFSFAEFVHQGTDETQAGTASVEEGLQLKSEKTLLSPPKS